ncbi:MAG TPA: hypothetical protein VGU72_04330 [Beijerinckiaceae bacterium]|jgi:hypothetical protein|nr:hypothetical protein [Beijerinckiaceae bacterium]
MRALRFFFFESFLRAPEGGAAGTDGGDNSGPLGSPSSTTSADPPAWTMPDGVPDHLKADNPVDFSTKVFEELGKQRNANREMGERFAAPKEVAGYDYKPSEKAAPFVSDLAKDPVYAAARASALKAGVPAKMFSEFVGGLYDTLADQGALQKPFDAGAARREFLGDAAKAMDDKQTLEAIRPVMQGLESFVDGLKNQKIIGDGQDEALKELLDTPAGMKALQSLQAFATSKGFTPGGVAPAAAGDARQVLEARRNDPRNDPNDAAYDKAFQEETYRMGKALHGLPT